MVSQMPYASHIMPKMPESVESQSGLYPMILETASRGEYLEECMVSIADVYKRECYTHADGEESTIYICGSMPEAQLFPRLEDPMVTQQDLKKKKKKISLCRMHSPVCAIYAR